MEIDIQWGGYYASKKSSEHVYSIFRILHFGRYSYQAALFREKFPSLPTLEEVLKLNLFAGHVSIRSTSLLEEENLCLLGGSILTRHDLAGYEYFLEAHGEEQSEIEEVLTKLIEYSKEPPIKAKLEIVGEEIDIEQMLE